MKEQFLIILAKIGVFLVAFCAPIITIVHSIIFLVFVDLLTAIMKNWKLNESKSFIEKMKTLESGKLRKSAIKLFLYILFIVSTYVIMMAGFGQTFFVMNFVFLSFSLVEITSIASNISIITGQDVFTKTVKKFTNFLTNKITKMFE